MDAKNGFISSEGELAERLTVFRFLRIERGTREGKWTKQNRGMLGRNVISNGG